MKDSKIHLTATQKNLIEKLGVVYEQSGITSVSARILALLLVADNPDMTFDQLQSTLDISKSATSTSLNLLINTGKVEQISKLGERKRFFRNRMIHWKEDMRKRNEQMAQHHDLLKLILKQRPGDTTEFNKNLKEMIDFIGFIQKELPVLYKKWESSKD